MKEDKLYLIHIVESIDRIHAYVAGLDCTDFMQTSLVQDAVLRNLQVLAESTQRLSADFKAGNPEIGWYKIFPPAKRYSEQTAELHVRTG